MFVNLLVFVVVALFCQENCNAEEDDSSEFGLLSVKGPIETNCPCGWRNRANQRIIGGEQSDKQEWPYMAAFLLVEYQSQFCGGTILTSKHVLTAAHCFFDDTGNAVDINAIGVVVGAHNISQVKENDILQIIRHIVHPKYIWPSEYDIAIVIVDISFNGNTIGPACLPTERFDVTNKNLRHIGWGVTQYWHLDGSEVLKKTMLRGVPLSDCSFYNDYDSNMVEMDEPYQFCTKQPSTSQCVGDSGGPVLWLDPDTNRYTLIGAISFGTEQCAGAPAVVSDVTYFIPWIKNIISKSSNSEQMCSKL